jgi:hypothetical protein
MVAKPLQTEGHLYTANWTQEETIIRGNQLHISYHNDCMIMLTHLNSSRSLNLEYDSCEKHETRFPYKKSAYTDLQDVILEITYLFHGAESFLRS